MGIALQIPPKVGSESTKRMSKVSLKQLKPMKPWISTWNIPTLRNDSRRRVSFTFQNFGKLFVNGKLTCNDFEERYSGSKYKPFLKYTLKTGRIWHALFHSIKGHTCVKPKIYERRVQFFAEKQIIQFDSPCHLSPFYLFSELYTSEKIRIGSLQYQKKVFLSPKY